MARMARALCPEGLLSAMKPLLCKSLLCILFNHSYQLLRVEIPAKTLLLYEYYMVCTNLDGRHEGWRDPFNLMFASYLHSQLMQDLSTGHYAVLF
jgi:hypothetical protein